MVSSKFISSDLSKYIFSGSAQTAYPTNNLHTYDASQVWKSTTATSQSLVIDFGQAKSCNCIVIHNHNMAECNDLIYLEAADDAAFTTNLFSWALLGWASDIFYDSFVATSRRYWRIRYSGTSTNPPFIGNIFLDTLFELPFSYSYGYKKNNWEFNTNIGTNIGGSYLTAQGVPGHTINEFDFRFVKDTKVTEFIQFVNKVKGNLIPFYFIGSDNFINYYFIGQDYSPSDLLRYNLSKIPLKMRSVSASVDVQAFEEPITGIPKGTLVI